MYNTNMVLQTLFIFIMFITLNTWILSRDFSGVSIRHIMFLYSICKKIPVAFFVVFDVSRTNRFVTHWTQGPIKRWSTRAPLGVRSPTKESVLENLGVRLPTWESVRGNMYVQESGSPLGSQLGDHRNFWNGPASKKFCLLYHLVGLC